MNESFFVLSKRKLLQWFENCDSCQSKGIYRDSCPKREENISQYKWENFFLYEEIIDFSVPPSLQLIIAGQHRPHLQLTARQS